MTIGSLSFPINFLSNFLFQCCSKEGDNSTARLGVLKPKVSQAKTESGGKSCVLRGYGTWL